VVVSAGVWLVSVRCLLGSVYCLFVSVSVCV